MDDRIVSIFKNIRRIQDNSVLVCTRNLSFTFFGYCFCITYHANRPIIRPILKSNTAGCLNGIVDFLQLFCQIPRHIHPGSIDTRKCSLTSSVCSPVMYPAGNSTGRSANTAIVAHNDTANSRKNAFHFFHLLAPFHSFFYKMLFQALSMPIVPFSSLLCKQFSN